MLNVHQDQYSRYHSRRAIHAALFEAKIARSHLLAADDLDEVLLAVRHIQKYPLAPLYHFPHLPDFSQFGLLLGEYGRQRFLPEDFPPCKHWIAKQGHRAVIETALNYLGSEIVTSA